MEKLHIKLPQEALAWISMGRIVEVPIHARARDVDNHIHFTYGSVVIEADLTSLEDEDA